MEVHLEICDFKEEAVEGEPGPYQGVLMFWLRW